MIVEEQLALFNEATPRLSGAKADRAGTFVDNMALPVHRWFRYSAGFAAPWVEQTLREWDLGAGNVVLDPFVGSGTVSVVCDALGIQSVGIEAHPVVARICRTKLLWASSVERFVAFVAEVVERAQFLESTTSSYPTLIHRSFSADTLAVLDRLRSAWLYMADGSAESELTWLALTAILRPSSTAGTAQWQYILPNKTKKNALAPAAALRMQVEIMKSDMRSVQMQMRESVGKLLHADARQAASLVTENIDAVITSPPYANNYDYADALRFEMTFWGDVNGWGDIHDKVRQYLIVSSSQHSSKDRLDLDSLLQLAEVASIRDELAEAVHTLAIVRESHGGKKHYHTMVAAYCRDISMVLGQLRKVCKPDVRMCWVIGDSAPYGIYCPIDRWIGELALSAGFSSYRFEKLRDRNIKWKNRKHTVPLKEGLLWIEG